MFVYRKHMYFLFFHTNPGSSFLALSRDMVFPWDARLAHAIAIYLICILIRTLYVTMYWTNIKIIQRKTFNLIFNLHFILYSCILKEIKAIRLFKSSGIFFFIFGFVCFVFCFTENHRCLHFLCYNLYIVLLFIVSSTYKLLCRFYYANLFALY